MARTLGVLLVTLVSAVGCGDAKTSNDDRGGPATGVVRDCTVVFGIVNTTELATLETWIDYSKAPGHFSGGGMEVECQRVDDRWAVWSVNQCRLESGECEKQEPRELTFVGRATHDILTPAGLARCHFMASDYPRREDFRPSITDASDEDHQAVSPQPIVEVTDIICRSAAPTTSTTVTLPDPCADVVCSDDRACVGGTCEPTTHYAVDVHVNSDETFGALQLDVLYDCSDGGFDGAKDRVECTGNSQLNASILFNDYGCASELASPRVVMSFVALHGFQAPVRLASCAYTSATGVPPTPDSFRVQVVDASAPNLAPIPLSSVATSVDIRPIAP